MTSTRLGQAALVGWRRRIGEPAAGFLAGHTRLSPDQARALLGALFFGLSIYYVVTTARRAAAVSRPG